MLGVSAREGKKLEFPLTTGDLQSAFISLYRKLKHCIVDDLRFGVVVLIGLFPAAAPEYYYKDGHKPEAEKELEDEEDGVEEKGLEDDIEHFLRMPALVLQGSRRLIEETLELFVMGGDCTQNDDFFVRNFHS